MTTLIQDLQHFLSTKDPRLPVETKRILLKEALQESGLSGDLRAKIAVELGQ